MDNESLIHLSIILGFVLVIIFAIARLLWERRWIRKRGIKAQGIVVALEEKVLKDVNNGKLRIETTYFPVIRYKTFMWEDKTVRYNIDFQASKYKVGDAVTVIYDQKKVERFVID
jgi:hypothetical protein